MGLLPKYEKCFFCGPATGGLALELQYDGGAAFAEFEGPDRFHGYDGVLHAGIVTGILDEVMWWALFMETRIIGYTWKMEVEFRRPVTPGKTYRASGRLLGHDRRSHALLGLIEDQDAKLCARATARFREMKAFTVGEMAGHLDFRGVPPEIRALFAADEETRG